MKGVLGFRQWRDPLQERQFSIPFEPARYSYLDYKMSRLRAFFHKSEIHSWFFNSHDKTPFTLPIWFYDWWTMFGCSPSILPCEAKEGWDFWIADTLGCEAYTKEVQFFRIFNIAWIFYWEYRHQNYLLNLFPLCIVRIYKVRWSSEYKTKLCGKENAQYFCRTKTKNYTIQNIHTFDKITELASKPPTPTKMEVSSSSTKSKSKEVTKKQGDILQVLKGDPAMRQVFLQKLLDNDD